MIMMCQSRFIFGKKCTILVSDVNKAEAMHMWASRGMWEICVLTPIESIAEFIIVIHPLNVACKDSMYLIVMEILCFVANKK